jgi:hypothetical protein
MRGWTNSRRSSGELWGVELIENMQREIQGPATQSTLS